jgi:hypothetical protein
MVESLLQEDLGRQGVNSFRMLARIDSGLAQATGRFNTGERFIDQADWQAGSVRQLVGDPAHSLGCGTRATVKSKWFTKNEQSHLFVCGYLSETIDHLPIALTNECFERQRKTALGIGDRNSYPSAAEIYPQGFHSGLDRAPTLALTAPPVNPEVGLELC